jgi:hypothetical protein
MGASATERGFRVDRMRGAKAPSLAIDAHWRQFPISIREDSMLARTRTRTNGRVFRGSSVGQRWRCLGQARFADTIWRSCGAPWSLLDRGHKHVQSERWTS